MLSARPDHLSSCGTPTWPDLPTDFVSVAGIDGAGKTTLARYLARRFQGLYRKQSVGRLFNKVLMDRKSPTECDAIWTEGESLAAAYLEDFRHYVFRSTCRPPGRLLVFDRWKLCVRAFSLAFAGNDPAKQMAEIPDAKVEFILDLPPLAAIARISAKRPPDWDETEALLGRLREAYLELAKKSTNAVLIDASAPFAEVASAAMSTLRYHWDLGNV